MQTHPCERANVSAMRTPITEPTANVISSVQLTRTQLCNVELICDTFVCKYYKWMCNIPNQMAWMSTHQNFGQWLSLIWLLFIVCSNYFGIVLFTQIYGTLVVAVIVLYVHLYRSSACSYLLSLNDVYFAYYHSLCANFLFLIPNSEFDYLREEPSLLLLKKEWH